MIELLNLTVPSLRTSETRNANLSSFVTYSSSIWNHVKTQRDVRTNNIALENLRRDIANINKKLEELNNTNKTTTATVVTTPSELRVPVLSELVPYDGENESSKKVSTQKTEKKYQNKVLSSYGKVVSSVKLSDVYNKELSEKLAKQSKKEAAGKIKSTGWCAKCVNDALEKAGLVKKNSTRRASAYMLERVFDNNKSFQRVKVSRDELKNLPAGCVVVWQNGSGFGNAFAKHGHIFITQGNGKATSDYLQDMKDYGTDFAVYVPV